MKIDEEMVQFVNEMVIVFGAGHIISREDIVNEINKKYGRTTGSIIPSDYCYNRINYGIKKNKPTVFEYLGNSDYKCLGEEYPFNGIIYHKSKESSADIPVGECKNGIRQITMESNYVYYFK